MNALKRIKERINNVIIKKLDKAMVEELIKEYNIKEPEPPLDMIIIEGSTEFCAECGSTIKKKKCINPACVNH